MSPRHTWIELFEKEKRMTEEGKLAIAKANIVRYYPPGGERKIKWTTHKSMQNKCHQCGRCCVLFGFESKKSLEEGLEKRPECADLVAFVFEHMVEVKDPEFLKRHGIRDYKESNTTSYWSCTLLGKDGLCTHYDSRPSMCSYFPRTGTTVPAECAFGGSDHFDFCAMWDENGVIHV